MELRSNDRLTMKHSTLLSIVAYLVLAIIPAISLSQDSDKKDEAKKEEPKKVLRIIAFGAHPDDAEFQIGGCAAKWVAQGHKVKLVSLLL